MKRRVDKLLSVRRRRAQVARARLRMSEHALAQQTAKAADSEERLTRAWAAGTTVWCLHSLSDAHASHSSTLDQATAGVQEAKATSQAAAADEHRAQRLVDEANIDDARAVRKREQREQDDRQGGPR